MDRLQALDLKGFGNELKCLTQGELGGMVTSNFKALQEKTANARSHVVEKKNEVAGGTKTKEENALRSAVAHVFLMHGMTFLSPKDRFSSLVLVDRAFRDRALRLLEEDCRKYHPSLLLAASRSPKKSIICNEQTDGHSVGSNENGRTLSWNEWRRFHLQEGPSRHDPSGRLWNLTVSELYSDIEVLCEVKQGDNTIWFGCEALAPATNDQNGPHCTFLVPHWTLQDAPTPVSPADDVLLESCCPGHCSLQQKTLCKAFYNHLLHNDQDKALLHVRIVFRRRSNGLMVTVVSQSIPNQVIGEDYGHPKGTYHVDVLNDTRLNGDDYAHLLAVISFPLYCTSEDECKKDEEDESSVSSFTYSTCPPEQTASSHKDKDGRAVALDPSASYTELKFRFEACERFIGNPEDMVVSSIRTWRWG